MSKHISQVELGKTIAQQTTLPQNIVDAFISQLFKEIEKEIIDDSFIKVEGLGLFRIIKSGDTKRVLFLGSKKSVEKSLDIAKFKNDLSDGEETSLPVTNEPFFSPPEITNFDAVEREEVVQQNRYFGHQTEHSKLHRKSNLVRTCIIAALVLIVLAAIYLIVDFSNNEEEEAPSVNFIELENTDTLNYSYIVIPESDVSLQLIAETYYGDEVFWPYIYMANEDLIRNILVIQAGSIIRIPTFMVDLAELKNGKAAIIAKKLGNEIQKKRTQ